jgi:hypothetical protein
MRAGKYAFRIRFIQFFVFPVTFSSICLESSPSIADHSPKDFSAVVKCPGEIGALVPSGMDILVRLVNSHEEL